MKIKALILALMMLVIILSANAQSSFILNFPSTIDTTTANGQTIAIKGTISNLLCCAVSIKMSVISQSLPYDWSLKLCLPSGCSSTTNTTFTLSPIQTDSVGVEFNTGIHNMANGTATIRFAKASDTTDFTDISFTLIYKPLVISGIEESSTENRLLLQNFPNPFSTSTTIKYNLDNSNGKLVVTDVQGKNVGEYKLNNSSGEVTITENLISGIYFYSLYSNDKMISKDKMIVQ